MTLEFEGLSYMVDNPDKTSAEKEKVLLSNLTGTINAGDMCALMGASGAGMARVTITIRVRVGPSLWGP